ncbi:hypothetical protein MPDQ_002596 [Monascus purpureus]|uniref:RED-like N-terminal domain-containing protein n=1 Tax=Monascus purpureus TaxID=5098 RepID=A0A507QP33_MONPU|nr:hypothetical protein MPDQ_002596 [Monascus purpureus]
MNNEQFRRLVLNDASLGKSSEKKSTRVDTAEGRGNGNAGTSRSPSAPGGGLLGSRMRSSIPMTPRSVTGVDFARQLAEHRREQTQPPSKRFKSSSAPKGTKLPSGYQDRAQLRKLEEEKDDVEKRVKALEEMNKLGQLDRETFEKLRTELGIGGDLKSTHMVKGLDWKLLRRVKAGEDVSKLSEEKEQEPQAEEEGEKATRTVEDMDEEFDRVLEEKEKEQVIVASAPGGEKKKKKGNMAPPPPLKRSRDEILRQLKASRAAGSGAGAGGTQVSPPAESMLGSKFKKVGDSKAEKKRWVEQDEHGRRREVLLVTDAEGKTKRKVRWLDKPGELNGNKNSAGLLVPNKDAKPLGMEVPAELLSKAPAPPKDEDEDIFEGVGADYNPLAGLEEDDSSDSSGEDEAAPRERVAEKALAVEGEKKLPAAPSQPRNYFSTPSTTIETTEQLDRSNPLTKDPTILAALKRAAALRQTSPSAGNDDVEDEEGVDSEILRRRKKFLEEARRREAQDAMDLDLGFGSSRIEDEEDDEAVLYEGRGGSKKRKRGPKKKKGDKDSAADVLRVIEGRKKSGE